MASPLFNFLVQTRSAALRPPNLIPPSPITLVLGNPSCDLDSFISATIYSFYHTRFSTSSPSPRLYIPILNLPSISAGELWRLRPEFGTALRLALRDQGNGDNGGAEDGNKAILENLVTISDIRSSRSSPLHHCFSRSTATGTGSPENKTSVVLVDHNVLSIPVPDLHASELSSNLDITGCIDHHIDESSVKKDASPRIIRTGIGSCTTLVVEYLKDIGLWRNPSNFDSGADEDDTLLDTELATLSLASILIDTLNLTAKGKVSDTDREIVSFLEDVINNTTNNNNNNTMKTTRGNKSSNGLSSAGRTQEARWDRDAFYKQILSSKAGSLSLLSLPEIFGRDYKGWSEKTTGGSKTELILGIAGVVKPICWLMDRDRADYSSSTPPPPPQHLLQAMRQYAREQRPKLDLFAIMTTSIIPEGGLLRELLVLSTGAVEEKEKAARAAIEKFEELGREELGLDDDWRENQDLADLLNRTGEGKGRIWWQRDDSKSRKQVAPLLREAISRV